MPEPYSYVDKPPQVGTDYSGEPSLAVQSFAEEADVNFIVAKYNLDVMALNAPLPDTPTWSGDWGTFVGETPLDVRDDVFNSFVIGSFPDLDYATLLNKVRSADAAFRTLPSDIRYRFNNNPQELLDFLRNPANSAEAVELGLVTSAPVAE